jgi:hypothetical protein
MDGELVTAWSMHSHDRSKAEPWHWLLGLVHACCMGASYSRDPTRGCHQERLRDCEIARPGTRQPYRRNGMNKKAATDREETRQHGPKQGCSDLKTKSSEEHTQ